MKIIILDKVRYLLFILIINVSIRVSICCLRTNSNSVALRTTFDSVPESSPKPNDYLHRTCETWDKPEDCAPRGMRYYKHTVEGCESLGFCDCFDAYQSEDPCDEDPKRKNIYMPEENKCYPIFSQGPCNEREWLIFDEQESIGKCVRNPCYPLGLGSNTGFWFYDPKIGQCHQALTQGYCRRGETLLVVHESFYPQCMYGYMCNASTFYIKPTLECRRGTRYNHYLKKCRSPSGIARIG